MKAYVAGFMRGRFIKEVHAEPLLALVRKTHPEWQAGRLNGIGGAIEDGETPLDAMRREWQEETGDSHKDWKQFARMVFPNGLVYFFKANVDELPAFPANNDTGEPIELHYYEDAVRRNDMIQNLKWLLPLAFEDPDNSYVFGEAA